ncbi:heme-binding protein [Flavobacterium sp. W22_SRS_FK3]|uniref:heme-binding protein n=1 Tax=Flavobacterium sp. W22_SRS_FK3 TaxID=3240275 RepID=UPI003F9103A3
MENSINLEQQKCPYLAQQAAAVAVVPDITTPLVSATNQPPVVGIDNLGLLNNFIGTWNSPTGAAATGYNVMPLPQAGALNGYITKNFPYFEEISFSAIAGGAPNREGRYTQASSVLFYEQRVYIADNADPSGAQPIQNTLIHAENGTWLYHVIQNQVEGPYGPGFVPDSSLIPVQDPTTQYNKQISVPHGVSVLMTGGPVVSGTGNPVFPIADRTQLPFTDPSIIDPSTYLTQQLNSLNAKGITVTDYSSINVSTTNHGGAVGNINFENSFGKVISMNTTWYVETLSNGTVQLQYVQNIILEFIINGVQAQFSHIDANTLQLVETFAQVNANKAWQNTGVTVQPGNQVTVSYKSGQWTADPATNGGNLYGANGCPGITVMQSGYPIQNINMGTLIGQVGTNAPFLIGDGPVLTPEGQSGALKLCINDDLNAEYGAGLTDNIGSLQVRIKI